MVSSSDATHQFILHLLRRNLVQAGGVVCNDGGQVGRIPLGGVHDLMQAPHLPGGQLHGGSEDVVFVAGADEGGRGGHQVGGGEGGHQQRVQRLLRVLGGVLGHVPLVDGGQLGQGERGRQMTNVENSLNKN